MPEEKVTITMSTSEVHTVLELLAKAPYQNVHMLIPRLLNEVNAQLRARQTQPTPDETDENVEKS